jgi:hypothetical protein
MRYLFLGSNKDQWLMVQDREDEMVGQAKAHGFRWRNGASFFSLFLQLENATMRSNDLEIGAPCQLIALQVGHVLEAWVLEWRGNTHHPQWAGAKSTGDSRKLVVHDKSIQIMLG